MKKCKIVLMALLFSYSALATNSSSLPQVSSQTIYDKSPFPAVRAEGKFSRGDWDDNEKRYMLEVATFVRKPMSDFKSQTITVSLDKYKWITGIYDEMPEPTFVSKMHTYSFKVKLAESWGWGEILGIGIPTEYFKKPISPAHFSDTYEGKTDDGQYNIVYKETRDPYPSSSKMDDNAQGVLTIKDVNGKEVFLGSYPTINFRTQYSWYLPTWPVFDFQKYLDEGN